MVSPKLSLETWRWITSLHEDGSIAMERDRALFAQVKNGDSFPVLRFYTWPRPTISYGRTQGLDEKTAVQAKEKGWDVVKRPTGGGKVIHGGDVCFSLIWRKETLGMPWNIRESYCSIHEWIQGCLEEMDIQTVCAKNNIGGCMDKGWCFSSPVEQDLLLHGKKIVGGAQWRDRKCALHQGSIQMQGILPQLELFKESFCNLFSADFL